MFDQRHARRLTVERHEFGQPRCAFENMPGFAARRGAGVEHALPGLCVEQHRRPLCGGILHRHFAFGKTRQRRNRQRRCERDIGFEHERRSRFDSRGAQFFEIAFARGVVQVDTQGHGRAFVVHLHDTLPIVRGRRAKFFQQPCRVTQRERWIVADKFFYFRDAAQVFAQTGVHQPLGPGLAERLRGRDGLVHGCVRGHAQVAQLVEPGEQQRVDVLVLRLQRFFEQQRGDAGELMKPAQRAVCKFLYQRGLGHRSRRGSTSSLPGVVRRRRGQRRFQRAVEITPAHHDLGEHLRRRRAWVGGNRTSRFHATTLQARRQKSAGRNRRRRV